MHPFTRRLLGGMAVAALLSCRPDDPQETQDAPDEDSVQAQPLPTPEPSWPGHRSTGHRTDVALVWQLPFEDGQSLLDATYDVDIAADSDFSSGLVEHRGIDGLSIRPDEGGLDEDSLYWWRIRAREGDRVSEWSGPRAFRTWKQTEPRPVLYQLVVRHFGNSDGDNIIDGTLEENGVGRFSDIDDRAVSRLQGMGITHVYLTGVLQQATFTDWSDHGEPPDDPDILKGRAGSFFAVRDYFDVSPDYADDPAARLDAFQELVERIHDAGMKVLIDLVPNHVARSYGSTVRPDLDLGKDDDQEVFFSPDNNFFYLEGGPLQLPTLGGDWSLPGMDGLFPPEDGSPGHRVRVTGNDVTSTAPQSHDWYETVKLNYGYDFTTGATAFDPIPPTWTFMDEVIAYWQGMGVDGFRADFAHLVPNEAWSWLMDEARDRDPDAFFVAEAYEDLDGLLQAGFDAVYEDDTYELIKGQYNGYHHLGELDDHLAWFPDWMRPGSLRYLENHDERRIASPIQSGPPIESGLGSKEAGPHVAPIAYLAGPGPFMIYNGQHVGEPADGVSGYSGDNGRTTIFDYWRVPALANWVNDGAFDGGLLNDDQRHLHETYRRIAHLAQHPLTTASGYYGLRHFNLGQPGFPDQTFVFGRYVPDGERLMVVVTNFELEPQDVTVRVPTELSNWAGLPTSVRVVRIFDEEGRTEAHEIARSTVAQLPGEGFSDHLPNQASRIYVVEGLDQEVP